uniref:Uncharacterized protein n=1 Tax=Arundo donax TaxID=35708 RepID=A0A0A9A1Z6_ARUDO
MISAFMLSQNIDCASSKALLVEQRIDANQTLNALSKFVTLLFGRAQQHYCLYIGSIGTGHEILKAMRIAWNSRLD